MSERTFPFISDDRIRLHNWPETKWVRVGGYGQVYFIGTMADGTEDAFFKDAKMAYNDEWELYAPNPGESTGFVFYDSETNKISPRYGLWENQPKTDKHDRSFHLWEVRITPLQRIETEREY